MKLENTRPRIVQEVAHQEHALRRKDEMLKDFSEAADIAGLITVLQKYAYPDSLGDKVVPVFLEETEEHARTVPHEGNIVIDREIPLDEVVNVLEEYRAGHISEQQAYAALFPAGWVIDALANISKVPFDSSKIVAILSGELPSTGGEGRTIEGESFERRMLT